MSSQKRQPGTPIYHNASARSGQPATQSLAHPYRDYGEIQRENQVRAFKVGVAIGFVAAALIFALILWLWVIPTMDEAVAAARAMAAAA